MENPFMFIVGSIIFFMISYPTLTTESPCQTKCGSLQVKYPFGTTYGCGSPRFYPYVTCSPDGNQLLLTTHTGSYPITSISYDTSSFIINPTSMSSCSSMHQSASNFGLDWASPFQLGPSTFLLLSCQPPTSALSIKGSPVCDSSSSNLCASIYTCPSVVSLGLPLFPPTNTCCVYSPANFDSKGELDLRALKCSGFASIVSLQDSPTDPSKWEFGVAVEYRNGAFDDFNLDNKCNTCENSGGACGFGPTDSFLCLCNNGVNSTTDCNGYTLEQGLAWSSSYLFSWNTWLGLLGVLVFIQSAC
ncbi:hypothetical protein K2173_014847 [Erythroxylum novogranatense]|uniref:non-specific serine/threonine protein kinase n=1 Tax=Erythroxylum novogranatense TaxID=1862640 RepID=A0AAV8THJ9_9ROSI|nr:hypothetical protein K2173_014847 [Erythroxylum novogranatense]